MSRLESLETARKHADAALAAMSRHGIAPTPSHFAIWYEHAAGGNPGLDRALAPVLAGNVPFSDELAEAIRGRYLREGFTTADLRAAALRLQGMMVSLSRRIADAGRDNQEYAQSLETFSNELGQAGSPEEIAGLIDRILSATEAVLERNRRLEVDLSTSGQQIGELKQHLEETRLAALSDSLTGMANRKHFEDQLAREARAVAETGEPLTVLLVDLDHFRRFNETYGHAMGDEVLKVVAGTLKLVLKGRDTAARFGGEEFAVVLPGTALQQGIVVAEHIRRGLATRSLTNRKSGESLGTVTVSIGVACYRSGEALAAVMERADKALQAAKTKGRNRVVSDSMAWSAPGSETSL